MRTRLTLRLEEGLVRQAKAFARASGKSVSQIVADYFGVLATDSEVQITPTMRSLKGILKGYAVDVGDYHRRVERKCL